jgi:hypothetical protein
MDERLIAYRDSQTKWWCPNCNSYRLPQEVEFKRMDIILDEEDDIDYYLVCGECKAPVRKSDLTNCKEVMINFVEGINWEDVRKHLDTTQINAFSLLCGEWKLGLMSEEKKLEYEKMLTLKDINKFSEFLTHWNYHSPFVQSS